MLQDSLSQWRSYCSAGNGVSIGFRVDNLRESALHVDREKSVVDPRPKLRKIEYTSEHSLATVDSMLYECLHEMHEHTELYEAYRQAHRYTPKKDRLAVPNRADTLDVQRFIRQRASTVKHKAFSSEAECRLIAPSMEFFSECVKFRPSRTTLVPYTEFVIPSWGKKKGARNLYQAYDDYFISCVVVGPTANPELTIDSLNNFFRFKRVEVDVRKSEVPFRDL